MAEQLAKHNVVSAFNLADKVASLSVDQCKSQILASIATNHPQQTTSKQSKNLTSALQGLSAYTIERLQTAYGVGRDEQETADRLNIDRAVVAEIWKIAKKTGEWDGHRKIGRIATQTILGQQIMDLINKEKEKADLTPVQAQELQEYVEESNMLRRRVLGLTDRTMNKFETVLDTIENARDLKSLTEALRNLNDVSQSPIAHARQTAEYKQDTNTTKPVSVNINLSNPQEQPTIIEQDDP